MDISEDDLIPRSHTQESLRTTALKHLDFFFLNILICLNINKF